MQYITIVDTDSPRVDVGMKRRLRTGSTMERRLHPIYTPEHTEYYHVGCVHRA